jgi:hypothetical protein
MCMRLHTMVRHVALETSVVLTRVKGAVSMIAGTALSDEFSAFFKSTARKCW